MATNKPKRKTYSDEFKEFLVQEAEVSGRSIASIARDNGINQNLLHNWKREHKGKQSQTDRLPARIDNNASKVFCKRRQHENVRFAICRVQLFFKQRTRKMYLP